ncbi:FixH family protein [Sorangium sp. So ce1151]|uniref:FixH family protein n=1 Tax=Sorangium sp. So ce1151 TaxID=3133332 RepID=UPI003F632CF9
MTESHDRLSAGSSPASTAARARGAVLALLVLGLVQGCGAPHADPGEDSGSRAGVGQNGRVEFAVEPTEPIGRGKNTFHVRLTWTDSRNPVKRIRLRALAMMLGMAHGSSTHEGKEIEPGLYEVADVPFSMGGLWDVQFRALASSLIDEAAFEYEVP